MDFEIDVDRDQCIGAGECVRIASRAFDQDAEAISIVVDPRAEAAETVVRALVACPVQAISLQVGGRRVRAEDLRDWMHGAQGDEPILGLLEVLDDDHQRLREGFASRSSGGGDDHVEELCAMTKAHLHREGQAYEAFTALVDAQLVDAFERDHGAIERGLDEVAALRSDAERRGAALDVLVAAVEDHMRIEETVLFSVVLAALGRRPREEAIAVARP